MENAEECGGRRYCIVGLFPTGFGGIILPSYKPRIGTIYRDSEFNLTGGDNRMEHNREAFWDIPT